MDTRLFRDTTADAAAWDAFVARSPQATSDHLWGWRRVLSRSFGFQPRYYGAFDDDQRLVGVLPLFVVPRGLKRAALVSIPLGNYGGICADSAPAGQALLATAKAQLTRMCGEYLELHHRLPMADLQLQQPPRAHSRFVLPLAGDPKEHLHHMGQNNRSKISRAARKGLSWHVSQDVEALYRIYLHSARRQGAPCFPAQYFRLMREEFQKQFRILFVTLDKTRIAFDLVLVFKQSMVCQFSGSLSHYYDYYPNEWLFWCAIQDGCALKLSELDFCRSRMQSGTAEFKRKLRFREEPLDYQYYLPGDQRLSFGESAREKYQWIIRTWQRLPLQLTRWLGPAVLRYLG